MASQQIFGSHDLVFTQNSKTREYVGGGYLLNSELLNCGAPAFMSGGSSSSGSGKKRRSNRTNSPRLNRSGSSDSESESGKAINNVTNVSDLLHKRVLAIPAGIFLINSATTAKQPPLSASSSTSFSSTYDDSRIRAMFDGNNSDDDDDDVNSDDDGNSDRMAKSAVISEDLYSKLFKMLAPNDADRKRYWVSAATTCRARNGIGKCTQESHHGIVPESHAPANKKTRKNRRANNL